MDDTSLTAILAEEVYVRGLARALLRDPNDVDDVVQQVWVRALEKPPRQSSVPRPWLRSVVRNLVVSHRRRESARLRREIAVGREDAVPSVLEIQAQESIRRKMIEHLLGLPRMYRDVLTLRFLRAVEPVEIGRQLGLSASTVRTRCARGVAMLRESMDRDCPGGRKGWQPALIAYAGLGDVRTDGAPRCSPATPMAKVGVLLTSLAVLGAVAAWALWPHGSRVPGPREVVTAATPPPPSEPSLARQEIGDPRRAVSDVHGQILHHDGTPAGGVRCWLEWAADRPIRPGPCVGTPRSDLDLSVDLAGRWRCPASQARTGLLWCELDPYVRVAFAFPPSSEEKVMRLPALSPITFRWQGERIPERWRIVLLPAFPSLFGTALEDAVQAGARYWDTSPTEDQWHAGYGGIRILPRFTTRTDGPVCIHLTAQKHEIAGRVFSIQTVRDAVHGAGAAAVGHRVYPTMSRGDRPTRVRAPATVDCVSKGETPQVGLHLLTADGAQSRDSATFILMQGHTPMFEYVPLGTHQMLRRLQHGRAVFGIWLDPEASYTLHLITDAGELFRRSVTIPSSQPLEISFQIGSGAQPVRVVSGDPTLSFDGSRVLLVDRVGNSSWPAQSLFMGDRIGVVSPDGKAIHLHQSEEWQEAWIINRTGHVAVARREPGQVELTCHWLPTRSLEPLDPLALAREKGFEFGGELAMEIKFPDGSLPGSSRLWRFVRSESFSVQVQLSSPIWHRVVPVGFEYRTWYSDRNGGPRIFLDL